SAPVAPTPSVSPSGGALATATRPSEPPAPGLFSTTTCRPRRAASSPATMRAIPSADAPGANGATICIAFCACAGAITGQSSNATTRRREIMRAPARWFVSESPQCLDAGLRDLLVLVRLHAGDADGAHAFALVRDR